MTEFVAIERADHVAVVRFDRPEARNALSPEVMDEIASTLEALDADADVRCIIVAGSEKIFASGADIASMATRTLPETLSHPAAGFWKRLGALKTPTIAAVAGYALGGGCELALACDMIVAADDATFGQPEVTLGIIPGGGGSQRLTRVLGKQRAMEIMLTGRQIKANEAKLLGFVTEIVDRKVLMQSAHDLARTIAERPPIAVRLAKQAVLAADETSLAAGLDHERRLYEIAMATEDRVEGMTAFLEKRPANFEGK